MQGIVQYNDESGSLDIASVCKTLTAGGVDPVDAFASVVGSYVGGGCMDNSWPNFLKVLTDTKADPNAGGVGIRAWTWQTCAQVRAAAYYTPMALSLCYALYTLYLYYSDKY